MDGGHHRNRSAVPGRLLLPALLVAFAGIDAFAQQGERSTGDAEEDALTREMERTARLQREDPFKFLGERAIRKLEDEFGKGFFKFFFDDGVIPRPYLVAVQLRKNADPEIVSRDFGEILGDLHEEFSRVFGGMLELEEIRRPVVVFVFESERKYIELAAAQPELGLLYFPGLGGYFNPRTGILYTWDKPDHWEVLFHEGTHQLMHHASKKWDTSQGDASPWLQEGIAEYLGGHARKRVQDEETGEWSYEFTFGQVLPERLRAARRAIRANEALSVRELVSLDAVEFQIAQSQRASDPKAAQIVDQVYCLGWALVMYLNQAEGGRLQPIFRQFVRAECRGELSKDAFADLLILETDADWAALDEAFQDWVTREL